MTDSPPLILVANDDGIASPGLLAVTRALSPLGRLLVVAPLRQHSAWGRAMPGPIGATRRVELAATGDVEAWSVDASPALTVRWALMTRAPRQPDLMVSGINYGENLGASLAVSGTVGAAAEAAGEGVTAFAVSLQTDIELHTSHSEEVDFAGAAAVTARLARTLLASGLPSGIDLLNVNLPRDADETTAWRWTRVSRCRYFESIVHTDRDGRRHMAGYRVCRTFDGLEPDADIRAVARDGVVSVSPVTLDMTAHGQPVRPAEPGAIMAAAPIVARTT